MKKPFKTAIIHFGADKTGTTSIQSVCDQEREFLYRSGVYYPNGRWHAEFGSCFCDHPEHYIINWLEGITDLDFLIHRDTEYMLSLRDELSDKSSEYLVFSYEGFPALDEAALEKMKAFLLEYTQECKILYYARSPESYAVSAMSQRVKMGLMSWDLNGLPIHPYGDTLGRLVKIFGRDNCIVRLFDRKFLKEGDVVYDFLSQVFLQPEHIFRITKKVEPENNSLSLEGLLIGEKIIQLVSRHNLSSKVFRGTFIEVFEKIKGQKIQLTKQQADKIREVSKRHSDYLESEFGIIFPESKQHYPEFFDSVISEVTAESIASMIIKLAAPELAKGQNKEVISSELQLRYAILREGYDIAYAQAIQFDVEFALDRDIGELEAGIHIWDTQKQWAFGVNSTLQKQVIRDVAPGIYRISHYVITDLPEGVYTAGFAFAEKLSDGSSNELMWYDKLCEFRVSQPSERVGVGYANLPSTIALTQTGSFEKNLICNGLGRIDSMVMPVKMKPSERINLDVEIQNDTDVAWKGDLFRPINLSYHWLKENDDIVLFDGVRTPVPDGGVPAQGSVVASMEIVAPEEEGKYKLMLTMVQESVGWFEDMEFQSFIIDIMVEYDNFI